MKASPSTRPRVEAEQLLDLAAERIRDLARDIEVRPPALRRAILTATTDYLLDLAAVEEVHR